MFRRASKKNSHHDAITAFLGVGTQYSGQFNFQGIVRIDGGVIGDIRSDGTLVLGEQGYVEGSVQVAQLITSGRIIGDVEASERAVLHKNSSLKGNLRAQAIVIEDGATINGYVTVDAPERLQIPHQPTSEISSEAMPDPTPKAADTAEQASK